MNCLRALCACVGSFVLKSVRCSVFNFLLFSSWDFCAGTWERGTSGCEVAIKFLTATHRSWESEVYCFISHALNKIFLAICLGASGTVCFGMLFNCLGFWMCRKNHYSCPIPSCLCISWNSCAQCCLLTPFKSKLEFLFRELKDCDVEAVANLYFITLVC